jgi:hypothetical protein
MKLLQIVYPGLGGSAAVALSLVGGQKKKFKYKNFFLFYGIENLLKAHIAQCKFLNIKFFFIKKKIFGLNIINLFKYCNKIAPDVIIVHDIITLPFYMYAKLNNKKIIFVHHTPDRTKKKYDWLKYLISGIFSSNIVLVSKRSKADFMHKLNIIFFKKKIRTIVNGVDTHKFSK